MKALVAGWFSFERMGATAGDLLARDVVCRWLDDAEVPYDIALAAPFTGGVGWCEVDPAAYSHLVFVCGPFGNGWPLTELLPRFSHCGLVGIDLSMLQSLEEWNPFDLLLERDSSRTARPDVAFLSDRPLVPVVARVRVHPQEEYGELGGHDDAHRLIDELLGGRELAIVDVDTRLDENATGLRTASEVESVIARADVVVTTRLHGLVLALKNGVPVVAVDPVRGGAKITRQAQVLGWPHAFAVDEATARSLAQAFEQCLRPEARERAAAAAAYAREALVEARDVFLWEITGHRMARPLGA